MLHAQRELSQSQFQCSGETKLAGQDGLLLQREEMAASEVASSPVIVLKIQDVKKAV